MHVIMQLQMYMERVRLLPSVPLAPDEELRLEGARAALTFPYTFAAA